jgi:AcrR family transcriptional regulator
MSQPSEKTKTESRMQAQQERILTAAQSCFVQKGFHAASMATIAETAGMSPGLIYRYFENKNAIILAIIGQQLQVVRHKIRRLRASSDLAEGIIEHFDEHDTGNSDSMSSALFLEMSAEATRDPQIAAALQRFDDTVRSELVEWLGRSEQRGGHGLPPDVASERVLMLLCLLEGLKVRKAREPGLDRRLLRRSLDFVIEALFPPLP